MNPLTKATLATAGSVCSLVIGGFVVPCLVIAIALGCAAAARVAGRLVRLAVLLALPIAVSIVLVQLFTHGGEGLIATVGPFRVTRDAAVFSAELVVRVLAVALAIGLFVLTTQPRWLVFELEGRGLSPRLAFVLLSTMHAVPAMVERADTIVTSQRARGLDTEGGLLRRARAIVPLVGPVVLSSLGDVEQRSLALEVRAFGRPGRRDLPWAFADTLGERILRWLLVLAIAGAVVARVTGRAG